LAFAIFNILLDIAILICGFVYFGTHASSGDNKPAFWVSMGNAILNAIASAFVIYGHFKRNPGFYLPYMMNSVNKKKISVKLKILFFLLFRLSFQYSCVFSS
jgi:hypothetical protein